MRRISREPPDPTSRPPQPKGLYLDLSKYEDWLMAQQQQICLFCRYGMILWAETGPRAQGGDIWLACQRRIVEGAKKNVGPRKRRERREYIELMSEGDSCDGWRPTRPHSSRMQLLDMLGYARKEEP